MSHHVAQVQLCDIEIKRIGIVSHRAADSYITGQDFILLKPKNPEIKEELIFRALTYMERSEREPPFYCAVDSTYLKRICTNHPHFDRYTGSKAILSDSPLMIQQS